MSTFVDPSNSPPVTYRARRLVADANTVLDGGTVTVLRGRIVAVGARSADGPVVDLGDVVLLPGFVNAHAHLDLSYLRGALPRPASFCAWLREVVERRQTESPADLEPAIRAAAAEMIAGGTTLVGDIAAGPLPARILAEAGLPAVVFREVLGLRPQRYEPLWQSAVESVRFADFANIASGLSPHAPYSTSPEIYRRAATVMTDAPLATHWLETSDEREFLATGKGPIREFLDQIGACDDALAAMLPFGQDPWNTYLGGERTGPRWLLVHSNDLTEHDYSALEDLLACGRLAGVVHCPRTHEFFGRGEFHFPFERLAAAGVPLALGTDSLASNPDLSVFNDARHLAATIGVDPRMVVRMATEGGAQVLNRANETGSLAIGKRADFAVIAVESGAGDFFERLLAAPSRVVQTMIGGEWRARKI